MSSVPVTNHSYLTTSKPKYLGNFEIIHYWHDLDNIINREISHLQNSKDSQVAIYTLSSQIDKGTKIKDLPILIQAYGYFPLFFKRKPSLSPAIGSLEVYGESIISQLKELRTLAFSQKVFNSQYRKANSLEKTGIQLAQDIVMYTNGLLPKNVEVQYHHNEALDNNPTTPTILLFSINKQGSESSSPITKTDVMALYIAPKDILKDLGSNTFLTSITNPTNWKDSQTCCVIRKIYNYMVLHDITVTVVANSTHVRIIGRSLTSFPAKNGKSGGEIYVSRPLTRNETFKSFGMIPQSVTSFSVALLSFFSRGGELSEQFPENSLLIEPKQDPFHIYIYEKYMNRIHNDVNYASRFYTTKAKVLFAEEETKFGIDKSLKLEEYICKKFTTDIKAKSKALEVSYNKHEGFINFDLFHRSFRKRRIPKYVTLSSLKIKKEDTVLVEAPLLLPTLNNISSEVPSLKTHQQTEGINSNVSISILPSKCNENINSSITNVNSVTSSQSTLVALAYTLEGEKFYDAESNIEFFDCCVDEDDYNRKYNNKEAATSTEEIFFDASSCFSESLSDNGSIYYDCIEPEKKAPAFPFRLYRSKSFSGSKRPPFIQAKLKRSQSLNNINKCQNALSNVGKSKTVLKSMLSKSHSKTKEVTFEVMEHNPTLRSTTKKSPAYTSFNISNFASRSKVPKLKGYKAQARFALQRISERKRKCMKKASFLCREVNIWKSATGISPYAFTGPLDLDYRQTFRGRKSASFYTKWYEDNDENQLDLKEAPQNRGTFALTSPFIFNMKLAKARRLGKNFRVTLTRSNDSDLFKICQLQPFNRSEEYSPGILNMNWKEDESSVSTSEVLVKIVEYNHGGLRTGTSMKRFESDIEIYRHLIREKCPENVVPNVLLTGDVWNTHKFLVMEAWGRKLEEADVLRIGANKILAKIATIASKLLTAGVALESISVEMFGITPDEEILLVDFKKAVRVGKELIPFVKAQLGKAFRLLNSKAKRANIIDSVFVFTEEDKAIYLENMVKEKKGCFYALTRGHTLKSIRGTVRGALRKK